MEFCRFEYWIRLTFGHICILIHFYLYTRSANKYGKWKNAYSFDEASSWFAVDRYFLFTSFDRFINPLRPRRFTFFFPPSLSVYFLDYICGYFLCLHFSPFLCVILSCHWWRRCSLKSMKSDALCFVSDDMCALGVRSFNRIQAITNVYRVSAIWNSLGWFAAISAELSQLPEIRVRKRNDHFEYALS